MSEDVEKVKKNIRAIYKRRIEATVALSEYYAGVALQEFRKEQSGNAFWTNRTRTAVNTVFSGKIEETNFTGFFLAHAVEYGVYLEMANDRKYEALRPVVSSLVQKYKKDLRRIWE